MGQTLDETPDLRRWYETMKQRPGVRRGVDVLKEMRRRPDSQMDEATRSVMFGDRQFAKR